MSKPKLTREQWLEQSVELIRPLFNSAKLDIPKTRVACGWPSSGGLGTKKRTIGQCWSPEAATDKVSNIFISPYLEDIPTVLATMVHELVHAAVGVEAKHGKPFTDAMKKVGLEGKPTATHAGERLIEAIEIWSEKLGPYPHGKLDQTKGPVKKQSTRMIKCECPDCGYVARTAKKWIEEVGAPHCPKHGEMKFELPEEDEDE